MGFISDPDSYDVFFLGGQQLPGELDLDEIRRSLAKSNKRGSGDDGAEPHFKGLRPCDFTIRLKLHTDEDEAEWYRLRPLFLDYNQSANRKQYSVGHPIMHEQGVDRCIVHEIGLKKPKNGDPILVSIACSSVKRRSGGTTKPAATRNVVTGAGTPTPFRPGKGPLNRLNALPLNERSASALEQARLDNGIPIDIAMPDGLGNVN